MKEPLDCYGTPTVGFLSSNKIYIDIKPIDDWRSWVYIIYFEDAMSPFFEAHRNGDKNHFISYNNALTDALVWLQKEKHINIIELPF